MNDDHHIHQEHENHYSDMEARVRALETILVRKGLVDPASVDRIIETYETKVGPRNGAKVVARAWVDPTFADWLSHDATAAIRSLGVGETHGTRMRAIFNSPNVHNVIVCTLCSCYPWAVLGLPPNWYKSPAYRSKVVINPRAVLTEFGLELAAGTTIRVWDSTAELRYLVIPQRPIGSEDLSEEALSDLVTRDSMIGTAIVKPPTAAS